MLGMIYAIFSFLFMFASGYGIACLLLPEKDRKYRFILAPLLGICIDAILLYYMCFYFNLPTKISVWILIAIVLAIDAVAAFRVKHFWKIKDAELMPFGASLIYLIILSIPFFIVGLNYMSIWNEDMYGYVVVADWLSDNGVNNNVSKEIYFNSPTFDRLSQWQTSFFSYFYRFSPELFLSSNSVILHQDCRYLFFPVLISFAMLTPLGLFMFLQLFSLKKSLIITILFVLPFFSIHYFSFILQLLGQSIALPVLFFTYWAINYCLETGSSKSYCILLTCLGGFITTSIEIAALLLPQAIYLCIIWISRKRHFSRDLKFIIIAIIMLILIMNIKTLDIGNYLLKQYFEKRSLDISHYHSHSTYQNIQFPYFLTEEGLPSTMGLTTIPLTSWPPFRMWGNPTILAMLLIAVSILYVLYRGIRTRLSEKRNLFLSINIFMIVLMMFTFIEKSDFLLFKMMLYFQPLLCINLVLGSYNMFTKSPKLAAGIKIMYKGILALFVVINLFNLVLTLNNSLGDSTVWVEWKGASRDNYLEGMKNAMTNISTKEQIIVVIPHFIAERWTSYVLKQDHNASYLNIDFYKWNSSNYGEIRKEMMQKWNNCTLVLVNDSRDVFLRGIPNVAIIWTDDFFVMANCARLTDYFFPINTPEGIIKPTRQYMDEIFGWYNPEFYEDKPLRWVENNSSLLIKNTRSQSVRFIIEMSSIHMNKSTNVTLLYDGIEFDKFSMSGSLRHLSKSIRLNADGIMTLRFDDESRVINDDRFIKIVNKEVMRDSRKVNAAIRSIQLMDENASRLIMSSEFDNIRIGTILNENILYNGIYEDGWVSKWNSLTLNLKGKSKIEYNLSYYGAGNERLEFILSGISVQTLALASPGQYTVDIPIENGTSEDVLQVEGSYSRAISKLDRRIALFQMNSLRIT